MNPSNDSEQQRSLFITTIPAFTLTLAYCQQYTPKRLPGRRLIAPNHLRNLANWLLRPSPQLRTPRHHPLLAAHLALLHAANLLTDSSGRFLPSPFATNWLHSSPADCLQQLLHALPPAPQWQHALQQLHLSSLVSPAEASYFRQKLLPQLQQLEGQTQTLEQAPPAAWQCVDDAGWQLYLPIALPPRLLFDLLQIGRWQPDGPTAGHLHCTPHTLAQAGQRGYGQTTISWLLEAATAAPLPARQRQQLRHWWQQGKTYRIRRPLLLETSTNEPMAAFLAQRRFRPHVVQKLSPRHVAIRDQLLPALQQWLHKQGYSLDAPAGLLQPPAASPAPDAYHWLGLRLLVGLGEQLPLPYPPPHQPLVAAAATLSAAELEQLDSVAVQLLEQIKNAMHGRDAFFPAQRPPDPAHLAQIEKAIASHCPLTIAYQALGEPEPRLRHIQPHHLENQDNLYYLHAYCYLAEAERIFRLDRLSAIHQP